MFDSSSKLRGQAPLASNVSAPPSPPPDHRGPAMMTRRRAAWALPLLLFAAALAAALAVLFVQPAPPAQAQSTPAISFESSAYVVPEIDGQVTIFLNASAAATSGITITVTASGGTATAGSDYTGTSWTPSILSGGTDGLFSIPITKDDSYGEGAETFTLTISAGTGYTVGTQGTATVTILDSPPGAIWQARLTVHEHITIFGCAPSSVPERRCSTATTLTSNTFGLDGTTYTIESIRVPISGTSYLSFILTAALPEAIQDYTLQVGSAQFPFGRGTTDSDGEGETWTNAGLTWAAGTVVDLVLLPSVGWERSECERIRTIDNTVTPPGRPSNVNAINLETTSAVLEWDPSAPTPEGGSVTDYIVYFFSADGSTWGEVGSFTGDENAATTYSETITGLKAGTTYEARVRARSIKGCRSGLSVPLTFTTPSGGGMGTENPPGRIPVPQQQQQAPPTPGQLEPRNVRVHPGDETLTITWDVSPREGFDDHQIRHALRWSQEEGVWANPEAPDAGGREDGISVQGGVYSYTITGLQNGVATGVFVRSFTGGSLSEGSPHSSRWVRIKGDRTTPGPVPQQQAPPQQQAQSTPPAKPHIDAVLNVHGGVYLYLCETASCGPPDASIVSWRSQYRLSTATSWTDGPRIDDAAAPSRNLYIGGLVSGQSYQFRVRAVNNAARSSPWSNASSAQAVSWSNPQQPNPPVHVRVTPGPSALSLSWDPPAHLGNADTISGYEYRYRKTTEQQWVSSATIRTSATIAGLSGSTAYQLQIRVYYFDSSGTRQVGRWTHALTATTLAASQTFTLPAAASGTEGGTAPIITIILGQAAPANGVSLSLTAAYTGQTATSADVLSMQTSLNIMEGQTVITATIPLVDDDIDEDDESFVITATSSTTGWSRHSASPAQIVVTIVDDDTAGITVNPTMLDIQEGGSATYTVVLDSQPTASVTVTPLNPDTAAAGITPAMLTFTTGNWQTPQTFTVTGVQDSDFADETVTIRKQITTADAKYTALGTSSVTVRVSDDDLAPQPTAPDAPGALTLTPGMAEIGVSWSAPASNGGSTLTGYDLEYKQSTATSWSDAAHTGLTTSATISGLTNGVQYDVRVRATNAIGDSAWSTVASATPSLALVEFARSRQTMIEGGSAQLTMSITPPLEQDSSVTVTVVRDPQYKAIVNQDYTVSGLLQGETLDLPAGAESASFIVHTVADFVTEGEVEELVFELSAVSGAPYALGGQYFMLVAILDTSVAATAAPGSISGFGLAAGIDDITASWDLAEGAGPPSRRSAVPRVTSFYADGSGNGVITWSPPLSSQTVTGYQVHFKETEASDWEDVSPVFADVTTDIHYTRMDDGVSYDVRVRAVISGVPGPWSDTFTKTFGPPRSDESIRGVAGYELEYKEADLVSMPNYPVTGDPATGTVRIYLDPEDASPHVIGGLDTFVGYKVRVRAWNVFGYGPWTPWEDATPTDPAAGMQWTSGLYIGNLSNGGTGCDNSETYKCNAVSTAPHPTHDNAEVVVPGSGALHTNEFSYGDTTYTIEELSLRNGVLRLRLDKDVPQPLQTGGYLETRVTRPFQANHWFKAGLPFADDVNADPKVLEWRGVNGNWPQPQGANARTDVILYGPGAERQQIEISAPAQALEGTEVKVRLILQPQDTTTQVSLSLRGSARYGEDYWLRGAGVDVLSDELAIAHVSFPAALPGQEARSQEVTLVINGDLLAEQAETISMVAQVVLHPTNPNLPDVVTPGWLEDRITAASLTIPENPGRPTGLAMGTVSAEGATTVRWVHPTGDGAAATGYQVQYRESGSDTWVDAGTAPVADALWSATLNVKRFIMSSQVSYGCWASHSTAANKCSTAATLTDNTFTLNGSDYTIQAVAIVPGTPGPLKFRVSTGSASNLEFNDVFRGYVLQVNGEVYRFDVLSSRSRGAAWDSDTRWQAGDTVSLRLVPQASHQLSGLSADTAYDVRVRATSAAGPGPWTLLDRPPGAPSRLRVKGLTFPQVPGAQLRGSQLELRWRAPRDTGYPSNAITGYRIQWRPDGDRIWRTSNATPNPFFVGQTLAKGNIFDGFQVWIAVPKDGVYFVRVRAVTDVGLGPWATADTAPPEAALPQAPANAIWSAELTVQDLVVLRGCVVTSTVEANKCGTATTLTDNTFTVNGVDYRVTSVVNNIALQTLQFNFAAGGSSSTAPASALHGYLLYVDGVEFAFREADTQTTNWADVDLTWDTGQKVRLWIVPRPPDPPNRIVLRPGHDEFMANWWPPSGPRKDAKGNVLPGGDADSGGAGIHQYQLRYTPFSNLGSDGWKIRTANAGDHHARVTTLEPGTRYRVQVRAVSDSGAPGPWSLTHLVDTYAEQYFYLHADRTTLTEGGASATVTVSIPFVWTENGGTHVSVSPCSGVREPVADCDADFTVNGFEGYFAQGGPSQKTFTISAVDDGEAEPAEYFAIEVSGQHIDASDSDNNVGGWSEALFFTIPASAQVQQSPGQGSQNSPGAPPEPGQLEPWNVQVTPSDGTLTVTWNVSPRDGFENEQIRHALRWSQVSGVWGNPPGQSGAAENGIVVEGGIARYVITGLENGVATGVFVRSFTGGSLSERSEHSSQWVRTKGDHTTPTAGQPPPQPPQVTPRTYSVTAAATAAESWSAVLTLTLSEAAPAGGVEFSVSAGYSGSADSDDVGSIASPVTVPEGSDTLQIAVPTVDDAVDEDDETLAVTVAAVTPGWDPAGGQDTATVTIIDDDTAGVTVTPTSLSIAEDGSATYTVVLDSQPTADVTVAASSGDGGAASVALASLTFTPSGWNVPLTFTVSGVDDADSNDESVAITHEASSADAKYQFIPVASISVAVADDDAQQQQQQPSPAPEPATPGQLEPANVQVTPGDGTLTVTWEVSPRDGFENEQIKHALRWSQVSGVWANPPDPKGGGREDGLSVEGGVTSYVITGLENGVATGVFVRSFTGGSYSERSEHSSKWVRTKGDHTTPRAGQSQEQQQVTPKTFSLSGAPAAEGQDARLTLTLSEAAPADGVEFTVSASYSGSADSGDVGSIASPVTVPEGGDTLTIAVPTVDDPVDEDDETLTVTIAAVTPGWDPAASGQDAATVTIIDDDTAGVTVTPTSLSIAEDGSVSYDVVLDSQPTGDVFVLPESSDAGAASVGFLPLVFDPGNWDTPQSLTVSGADDADSNDESVAIIHEASSGDAKYHRIPVASVSVTVADDDVQQQQQVTPKTFSLSSAASAAEGQDARLTLTLSEAAPAGGVEFSVSAGYSGSAASGDVGSIASPVTVLEGSDTLTIAVPTVDDAVDEDDETFTVTIAAVTQGWDPAGSGQDAATVTILDDDTAGVTITPTSLSIAEDGSVTYTVVLDSQPAVDVTVTASSGDGGAAGVSPASVTFTPSGWNVPLTFTVSGVGDGDRDDESVAVSHRASSNDGRYEGIAVAAVAVAVADTTPPPAPESTCPEAAEPPEPGQWEPYNVCVTPGDGTLTVTWTVASRDGFEDHQIKHSLRWSQEPGVWANPPAPEGGREDGIPLEGGVYSYTITGLENGVATGVFVRSFTGGSYSERSPHSSKWVRTKGDHTTPRAE